jgi:hypothetical protein
MILAPVVASAILQLKIGSGRGFLCGGFTEAIVQGKMLV